MQPGRGAEPSIGAVATCALAFLVPVAASGVLHAEHGPPRDVSELTTVHVFDAALLVIVAYWARSGGVGRLRPRSAIGWVIVAFCVALAVSVTWHPSVRGFEMLLRALAAVAVYDGARRFSDAERSMVLGAIVASGCLQAALAVMQSANDGMLGLPLIEFDTELFHFGGASAGQGGFFHPYLLTGFLATAASAVVVLYERRPRLLALAAFILVLGVTATFSRAGLLGLTTAGIIIAALPTRRAMRLLAVSFILGLTVGLGVHHDGWLARAGGVRDGESIDSGRRERVEEAFRLIESEPITGVGLGRYVTALREVEHERLLHSHNTVIQLTAEAGAVAGVLFVVLLARTTITTSRYLPSSAAVIAMLAPFWLLDAFTVVFPAGLAITALCSVVLAAGFPTVDGARTPTGRRSVAHASRVPSVAGHDSRLA